MTVKGGPKIETDGLVFHLDAASSSIGKGYSTEGLKVDYLIVGGGGGSAPAFNVHASSGGGGAGAFREGSTFINSGTSFSIVVGAGGSRTTTTNCGRGSVGGDSSAFGLTSNGGAGAGTWCSSGEYMAGTSNGNASGSGSGGAGVSTANVGGSGGDFGNDGGSHTGTGNSNGTTSCGGGGGAGGPGGNGVANQLGGNGGIGKSSNITGRGVFYAGGGAGGSTKGINNDGGGRGGGGNRGNPPNNTTGGSNPGENGSTNTGGGGGGASGGRSTANGGNGGSGIVILRYRGKQKATGGDTIQYKNGYTIHTFTSSGTLTFDSDLSNGFIDGTSRNKVVGELINMDSTNYKSGNKGYWNLATDEYIDCSSHVDDLIFSSPATISTWLMPLHDKNAGSTFFFIGNDTTAVSNGTGAYGFLIRYGATTGALTGETFVVYRYDGGNAGDQLTLYGISDGYEYQNQWVNATVVVESNTWKLYVNGILQTLTRGTFWTGAQFKYGESMSPKNRALIGTSGANVRLADVKVYNTALTQQQILDNYNATKGRFGL